MNIRIIFAEGQGMIREGLKSLIEKQDGIEIVAEAEDGRTAVRLACELLPDVVIMGLNLPEMNGIEATRRLVSEKPDIKVIGLSMQSDKKIVSEMLRAGASAYLLKGDSFEELLRAIGSVIKGHMYLSPMLSTVMLKEYLSGSVKAPEPSVFSTLTPREREVLQMIAEGKTTKTIASTLSVSVKTVETHRQQIMSKLNTRSIAHLTKYAVIEGLTTLEIQQDK